MDALRGGHFFRGLAFFLAGNVAAYWRTLGHLLSGSHGTGIVLAGLWGIGALAGALRAGRSHAPLLLSVAAAAASMVLWPGAHSACSSASSRWRGCWWRTVGTRDGREGKAHPDGGGGDGRLRGRPRGRPPVRRPAPGRPPARRRHPARHLFGVLCHGLGQPVHRADVDALNRARRPGDRVLVDWPAAVYLRTGLPTMNPDPAQSAFVPTVFDAPGRFLAATILRYDITLSCPDTRTSPASRTCAPSGRCRALCTPSAVGT